jgi:transcriptional regulator with XRE-family HTH domain
MARATLGWSVHDLGKRAGVAGNTVSRFENGSGAMVETLVRMQTALENAGVVFIPSEPRPARASASVAFFRMPPTR